MKKWIRGVVLAILAVANTSNGIEQMVPHKIRISENIINVTTVGAMGNGQDDDTAAVQRALDLAASTQSSVYFPKGTYMIDPAQTLLVQAGTRVFGEGKDSIIRASTQNFGWELMRITGSGAMVSSLRLDGNHQVNRVLVVGGGVQDVKITAVIAESASQASDPTQEGYAEIVCGIVINGSTNRITIDRSEVRDIVAIHSPNGSMIARGIYITTSWQSNETVAQQVSITNSYIHQVGPADDGDGIYYEDPAMDMQNGVNVNSVISGNLLENCAKRAMKIYAQGIKINGNHIINSYLNNNIYQGTQKGTLAPDMYSAISIYGSNNIVFNNVIDGPGSFYAAIEVTAVDTVNNTIISNNKITMGSKSNTQGTTAIRLGNIHNFTIKNNVLMNGERGIWAWQDTDFGVIKDNQITMKKGGIDLSTYLSGYTQTNIALRGNVIMAGTFDIMLASTNKNVTVIRA
ncbi:hypothetical protein J2Z69_003013 [Paenibacillus shirakamiensis]|uniref:Rhamnogalacturonase A/B/Epimerase-like pectate lyase domain-containing protein n=1 Tax=Paenibacillus shirakamiensis TaxID=1265935 RepID=A0ABS4JJS6_9BACL|nr:glycosyl hydrolase family 28-related protein [Paenibacillus shirakamiensis]MBP2001957.1 hypothetical protein [Paenibacillus shirakamiensis]